MSRPADDSPNDKSPRRTLEIDLHGSRLVKATEEAGLAPEKQEELMREVEKHSGGQRLREHLALIEGDSILAHAREAARLFEEPSAMRAIREMAQSSVQAHARMFEENSVITHALEALRSDEGITRMAMGPMWELRRAGLFDEDTPWRNAAELASQAMASFEARFRLPDQLEAALLADRFRALDIATELTYHNQGIAAQTLQRAMEKMSTPWLDQEEAMRSIAGFAEIQRIGEALRSMPAFDESLTASLREGLGDWRDPISWRPEIFTDLAARGDLYVQLGFNPALTGFPLPAFKQGLRIAGLEEARSESGPAEGEEDGLVRTNSAHDRVQRLERMLRRFIDRHLTRAYGPDWPKHRLPNGVSDQWREKKRKAEEAGSEVRPLIEYADFTDYPAIICRKDNWREVFQSFFRREESVRETFQRLHPIRLDIAHARLITQDDELLLQVEVRRLEKAIETSPL
jgi:hypothetical protein